MDLFQQQQKKTKKRGFNVLVTMGLQEERAGEILWPGGLTHSDFIGVVGVGERQVDHVILPKCVVQTRVFVLPSLQHQRHSLLISCRGGHVRLLGQLPAGKV